MINSGASKDPLSERVGAHVRSIESEYVYSLFEKCGLRCMDISKLALACALKEHLMSFRMTFRGALKDPLSEKGGRRCASRESEYVYSLFQKCWFEAYGHL